MSDIYEQFQIDRIASRSLEVDHNWFHCCKGSLRLNRIYVRLISRDRFSLIIHPFSSAVDVYFRPEYDGIQPPTAGPLIGILEVYRSVEPPLNC